ncbi:carboxylesterase [Legionella sp. km772]|uniref:alpha/beta hydrolase n=1 Tax=Legionella sp. km772 TaxID=2498111 RepID=UPI000F8DFDBB|nr:alpha/beta fold hydrolase [Legionella sp. km772]RUR13829.1 alpha/beta fold hydrolase [Legionella sp. km772]
MNIHDFRYMRQGQQLSDLKLSEEHLLTPFNQRGEKKEHALLIFHGFSSSPAVYRGLIPKIKHYDALICPVLPGHADSIHSFSQAKASQWLNAAHEQFAALSKEYKKIDVLGLSLGGLLSCELSKTCAINHLYLLAPALKLHMNIPLMLNTARLFSYLGFVHLRNAAGNILNPEHGEITYRKLPLSTVIEMLQLVDNYQWQAPSCPVDLFLGAHDLVVNSHAVEELFLPLANTQIHWLKNSAHVLPLDNDLNEIIQCINKKDRQNVKVKT